MNIDTHPISSHVFATVRRLAVGGVGGLLARWQTDVDHPLLMGRYVTQRCRTQRAARKQARKALCAWVAGAS